MYDGKGNEDVLDVGPRMEVLLEVIQQSKNKVVAIAPFVAVVKKLLTAVRKEGYTAEAIYGEVSKNEPDRIFSEFQSDSKLRVLVAQPGAMSHGLTLTTANTIVWFAPITSNETYLQANARITRPGQKVNQLIVMIEGTVMERRYYQRWKDKQKVQGLFLEMVRESRVYA